MLSDDLVTSQVDYCYFVIKWMLLKHSNIFVRHWPELENGTKPIKRINGVTEASKISDKKISCEVLGIEIWSSLPFHKENTTKDSNPPKLNDKTFSTHTCRQND